MENDLTKMEDDQNGRQPKMKTTKHEDDQRWGRPKMKTTKNQDEQNDDDKNTIDQ